MYVEYVHALHSNSNQIGHDSCDNNSIPTTRFLLMITKSLVLFFF
jgi:hypothetical protein